MISIAPQKLKQARLKSKLSVDDICSELKIGYSDYIDLEHDKTDIVKRDLVDRLSRLLGVRDTDILKG